MISDSADTGAHNMQKDVMLLDMAISGDLPLPILRFYKFSPAVITLGHHQKKDPFDFQLLEKDGLELVQRPTGGRAILHDDELTYSIIVPKGFRLSGQSVPKSYLYISMGLVKAFQNLGLDAKLLPGTRGYIKNPSCFSSASKFEIACNETKFIGSAQKRKEGAILQQGSILLGPAYKRIDKYLPEPTGLEHSTSIEELLSSRPSRLELENAIIEGLEKVLKISFIPTKTLNIKHD